MKGAVSAWPSVWNAPHPAPGLCPLCCEEAQATGRASGQQPTWILPAPQTSTPPARSLREPPGDPSLGT